MNSGRTQPSPSPPDVAIGLATAAVTLAVQLPFVRHQALLLDEGVVLQMAADIGEGKVPYRDAVHYAFPGIFYLTALVFEVFGPSVEAGRILAACLFSTAAAAMAMMCRWWCTRFETILFVVLLLAYRVWAFPHWHMLNYSPLAVTMSLVAAWLAGEQLRRSGYRWAVAAGVFAGAAVLGKQDSGGAATAALASALLLLVDGSWKRRWRTTILFSTTATIVVVASLAGVWWQGYLGDLIREGIYGPLYGVTHYDYLRRPTLFPLLAQDADLRANWFSYFPQILWEAYGSTLLDSPLYQQTSFYDAITKLIYHLPWMAALLSAAVCSWHMWGRRSVARDQRLLVTLLAGAFVAAFNPPHDWVHLLVLYPPTLLLLASASPTVRQRPALAWLASLFILLAAGFSSHLAIEFRNRHSVAVHSERGTFYTQPVLATGFREVLDIVGRTPRDRPLMALPYHPFLNFLADRPSLTRYLFLWPVEWNKDRDREIIDAIESTPQATILYSPSQLQHLGPPRDFAPELFAYLVDHFEISDRYGADDPGLGFLRLRRVNATPGDSLAGTIRQRATVSKRPRIGGGAASPLDVDKFTRFELWPFRRVVSIRTQPAAEVTLRFPMVPADGDRLVTAYAVPPERWSDYFVPMVAFRLVVSEGEQETTLAYREIETAKQPSQRRWYDVEVDLSPWQGREIEMALSVATLWGTDPSFELGAWEVPRIARRGDSAAR